MNQNDRIVIKFLNGGHQHIPFIDLKKDDIFLLFEADLTPVTFKGIPTLIALSDAYINPQGVGEIHMKEYNPEVLH